MAYRRGVNKRYPDGTQPLCEAVTSTIKSTLFLSDAAYRAVYRQFQEICLARGIRQKLGVREVVWQGAVDALIRQNTDIDIAINVIPGTPSQLQDRRTVLGTMCRQASKNLRARRGIPAPSPQIAPALSPPPVQSALVLEDTHAVDEMRNHQEIPIDPVLLAHDASMKQQAAHTGAQLGEDGVEVSGHGKKDVGMEEEGMEEELREMGIGMCQKLSSWCVRCLPTADETRSSGG